MIDPGPNRPRPRLGAFTPARGLGLVVAVAPVRAVRPAPAPRPRRVASGLEGLLTEGTAAPHPSPALAAAQAFSAGDGFLPGQMIDRTI
jgi:hypothetical protein